MHIISMAHTRMRLGLSPLKQHLHSYHIVPSPCCPHCDEPESTTHILLKCDRYAASRSDLFSVIGQTVDKLGIGITNECQINNILLFGHTLANRAAERRTNWRCHCAEGGKEALTASARALEAGKPTLDGMARNSKETASGRHHCAMGRQTRHLRAYLHQRRSFFLLRKFCCGYIKTPYI